MCDAEDKAAALESCSNGPWKGWTWEQLTGEWSGLVKLTDGRVTTLILNRNQLTALPEAVSKLTSLRELFLNQNRLTVLSPDIGKLTSLTRLDLRSNMLTDLPPAILENLTSLTTLDLDYNQLATLPSSIDKLTSLTSLDLNWNQLTALPPTIDKLTSLTYLNLNSNNLTLLPPSIGKLTRLQVLVLENNAIAGGLENIRHLTKLVTFSVTPRDLLESSLNLPAALRDVSLQDKISFIREKYAKISARYCVLACLSSLTKKLNAGEYYAAKHEGEDEGAGGDGWEQQGDGGRGLRGVLQGVLAFEIIASADVWRYILEFV